MHLNFDVIFSRCRLVKMGDGSSKQCYTVDTAAPPNTRHFMPHGEVLSALECDAVKRGVASVKADKLTKECNEFHACEETNPQIANSVSIIPSQLLYMY